MAITAVLFDAEGVLYHRPRANHHLTAFFKQHGITPRHPIIVERALRAAAFDVQSGRIPREVFFDAVLRTHGLSDESLFGAGRAALLQDAADIELFPGVRETLTALQRAGYRLGVITNTAHPAHEQRAWLAARGLLPDLWSAFVTSSEAGLLKPSPPLFELVLRALAAAPYEAVFVGHASEDLAEAAELGMLTVAFMPDDPHIEAGHVVSTFYGLQELLSGQGA